MTVGVETGRGEELSVIMQTQVMSTKRGIKSFVAALVRSPSSRVARVMRSLGQSHSRLRSSQNTYSV